MFHLNLRLIKLHSRNTYKHTVEYHIAATSSCTVALQESLNDNAYRVYSSVPELLSAVSYILIIVGVTGFLCAQVPYSMKGLIVHMGIYYGSLVLFLALNKGIC